MASWRWWRPALAILAAQVLASHALAQGAAGHPAGSVVIETGVVTAADGSRIPYEIGTLYVPENRERPGGRTIGVGFARLKSISARAGAPTFHLPGGPGSSYLGSFTESDPESRRKLEELLLYRAVGDVIVLDQRGYSNRGERLVYPSHPAAERLDRPGTIAGDSAAFVRAAKAAVAANADKDLAGYTVIQCAEDVNDLRKALGYRQIRLVGQSFGSQWSFAVMRVHPEIVERALLSGVEPLNYAYDMPSHIVASLQRMTWDADRDPGLKPYLPDGGLMAALRVDLERLAQAPVRVSIKDGKTGRRQTVVLGVDDFRHDLLTEPARWPAFILSVYYGHYDGWARKIAQKRKATGETEALIGPLIDTSLGVTPARQHLLRTDAGVEFMGWWDFDSYIASRPLWPSPDVGDDFRTPVLTNIPVLFIHGDWDTSTPVENTLNMLPYFPNSRAILIHRGGHNARAALTDEHSPVIAAAIAFLGDGDTKRLPVTAELPAPRFLTPDFKPPSPRTHQSVGNEGPAG